MIRYNLKLFSSMQPFHLTAGCGRFTINNEWNTFHGFEFEDFYCVGAQPSGWYMVGHSLYAALSLTGVSFSLLIVGADDNRSMEKILRISSTNDQAYALIELAVVAAIMMFAGVFLIRLGGSIQGRGQSSTTDNRMTVIDAKIRQYYLAHGTVACRRPPACRQRSPCPD